MASDTMESAIAMEVAAIRQMLQDARPNEPIGDYQDSILVRLDSIERTLEEGDPQPGGLRVLADSNEQRGE
jgi:hypothetical protein